MLQNLIAGARVSDAADSDFARLPPQLTLDVFAGEYLGEKLGAAALVERGEELLGLIGDDADTQDRAPQLAGDADRTGDDPLASVLGRPAMQSCGRSSRPSSAPVWMRC